MNRRNRTVMFPILVFVLPWGLGCTPHRTANVADQKVVDSLFGLPPFRGMIETGDSAAKVLEPRGDEELTAPLVAAGDSLGVDLADSVENRYNGPWSLVTHVSVPMFKRVNFSHPQGGSLDCLVEVRLESDESHGSAAMIFVFIEGGGKYTQKLFWAGYHHADDPSIEFPDIDSDGRAEIEITSDASGNGGWNEVVELYRFEKRSFALIFNQSLSANFGLSPYTYSNHVEFARNRQNHSLLDIRFRISTGLIDDGEPGTNTQEVRDRLKEYGLESFTPVRDTVLFVFDGRKYVPSKPVPDYAKPFNRSR